jgi:selenocysteine-specific translation elongation factor
MVLLVIDATKGMQTQTAEGIVVAGVTVDRMLVVLNKVSSGSVGSIYFSKNSAIISKPLSFFNYCCSSSSSSSFSS